MVSLFLLASLFLDPTLQKFMTTHPREFLALKMEDRCQEGCHKKKYDQGHWIPNEKQCFCGDLWYPDDLVADEFTLQWKNEIKSNPSASNAY